LSLSVIRVPGNQREEERMNKVLLMKTVKYSNLKKQLSLYRIISLIRAILYKLRLRKIKFPCLLGKPLLIIGPKKISIEKNVRILPGARIETHQNGEITIQENVSIGHNLHIAAADNLIIEKNTTISGNVLITDLEHGYQEVGKHIMEQDITVKQTIIGENCFIGYGVCILSGTKLGKQCVVAANSVVKGEFPDYCVIAGAPAKVVKKLNPQSGIWEKVNM